MSTINVLGIIISSLNKQEVNKKINEFLEGNTQHYIVTANPEIILTAKQDEEFFYIVNNAGLTVIDGFGLKIAAFLAGKNIERITGVDLLKDILAKAQIKRLKIGIVNWAEGLSSNDDIKRALDNKFPGLDVVIVSSEREAKMSLENLNALIDFRPDILFANLGAPWQEKLIFHNLKNIPSVKLGIGIGGALDFLTGKIHRAPKFVSRLGLEWLWRLFKQPRRIKRIYNAVLVFSYRFFLWRFIHPFQYRKNVACILYKKEEGRYKILIVERATQKNHWQLPQGGTDGENIMKAGIRELAEELNNKNFKPVYAEESCWTYEFADGLSKFNVKSKESWGYRGQRQALFISEFIGNDNDIKINFWEHTNWKWVDSEELVKTVFSKRQEATKIFLDKFYKIIKK